MEPPDTAVLTQLGSLGKALERLAANVKDTSAAIRADVAQAEERNRSVAARNRLWQIGIAVLLCALFVVGSLTFLTLLATRDNAQATQRNTDVIADCTKPGGRCYEDGRKRSSEVVRQLNDAADARTQMLLQQVYACNLDATQCTSTTTTTTTTAPPGVAGP